MTLGRIVEYVRVVGTNDLLVETGLVTSVVRRYADAKVVSDPTIVRWATDLALRSLEGGASVSDACREGRRVVDRWLRLEERASQLAGLPPPSLTRT
jgi:hypothetical protein